MAIEFGIHDFPPIFPSSFWGTPPSWCPWAYWCPSASSGGSLAGWQVFGCFAKMGAMKSTMNLWEKTRGFKWKTHVRTWSENKSKHVELGIAPWHLTPFLGPCASQWWIRQNFLSTWIEGSNGKLGDFLANLWLTHIAMENDLCSWIREKYILYRVNLHSYISLAEGTWSSKNHFRAIDLRVWQPFSLCPEATQGQSRSGTNPQLAIAWQSSTVPCFFTPIESSLCRFG